MNFQLKNNTFTLLPEKAIWWESEHTLLLSDLHIGKTTHFRKAGIAVPQQVIEENFERLDRLMQRHQVKRIVFVGDLFHSEMNSEWDRFCTWRNHYADVEMILVLGNHDRFPVKYYEDLCLIVYPTELRLGDFIFAHEPKPLPDDGEYIISGHVHPVVKLRGLANQRLTFPCFYFGQQQALLPSFGAFTGGYVIEPQKEDCVFVVVEDKLVKVQ